MSISRLRPALALSVALSCSFGLASCGSDAASSTTTGAASANSVEAQPTTTPPPDTAPTETIRIVSLSPSATEMVYAIGAGDLVVAVDDQSNYPPEALEKSTDLSGITINIEAISTYEPTLVLHDGTSPDLGAQLEKVGIADWVGPAPTTFDDIYAQIEQLGAATGHSADAAEVVASMKADIDAAVSSIAEPATGIRFYHELDNTFYSVTSNGLIGHVYAQFGLENIADLVEGTTDYPQLSEEFIVSQSPDLIFLADTKCCGQSAETVAARPGWGAVAAVVNGNVIELDDDIASRWGPRIVEFVQQVAAAVSSVQAKP